MRDGLRGAARPRREDLLAVPVRSPGPLQESLHPTVGTARAGIGLRCGVVAVAGRNAIEVRRGIARHGYRLRLAGAAYARYRSGHAWYRSEPGSHHDQ
ncbi:hypothetical protein, partial [Streptomyces sp. T21Q-yed]|uniref:hypothetical protein n=1 Tax=Streptomyces sp. T21Q-yed TaxID=3018441 RepID=UPI0023DEF631